MLASMDGHESATGIAVEIGIGDCVAVGTDVAVGVELGVQGPGAATLKNDGVKYTYAESYGIAAHEQSKVSPPETTVPQAALIGSWLFEKEKASPFAMRCTYMHTGNCGRPKKTFHIVPFDVGHSGTVVALRKQ